MLKILVGLLLLSLVACSPQNKPKYFPKKQRPIPDKLKAIYQISQQTSYPLFDSDFNITEVRVWKLISMVSTKHSLFLKDHTVYSQWYNTVSDSNWRNIKVVSISRSQEQILDQSAERNLRTFPLHGGLGLTLRKGVDAVIDSLFAMGFDGMQSQSQDESLRVGDGTENIIEVRRGNYYKYVYYHSPEHFKNNSARKFIQIRQFLTTAHQE